MAAVNYGSRRLVVGAHYGLRDWLAQRVSALAIVAFTLVLVAQILLTSGPLDYTRWAAIFSSQWMKTLTFTAIVALAWHAWVGAREVLMDYAKPTSLRMVFYMLAIVWLISCAGWAVQVLWRL
ncbi:MULTISPECIES: succinate dehydrogenase, hydrophobic membrane anchor protein [Ottowia]|jgi:hypothetical protein|uniref:Succinate dehydrogenase hydrophobic membrane anchor subunit n=1 Tax=Ottowia cancrivicina TaxID=3040346 RepID=A0AAW6RM40_9BURK|nr:MULTISPECIES: succinate dehydrogenase, hydrophobic membrane anchor protein [Ottowia]AKU66337.1 succinate dehydrogenase [Ottowia sp. oral taxon 894]MDG9699892.1 succinate dehydrogenase, hydrophobic membrane anchor protein [Ottowia sp. 10c7w1]